MKVEKEKKNSGNKAQTNKQKQKVDETEFLEYDAPYKDDPFKEHEVIIS